MSSYRGWLIWILRPDVTAAYIEAAVRRGFAKFGDEPDMASLNTEPHFGRLIVRCGRKEA